MTRSVEELRRESERNRAEFTATVGRLKRGISDTTQDLREIVSPQHLKSEVTGYVSDKAHGWIDDIKQKAIDNPMGAVAAGTALAVPLLRMARGVPLPLLMVAAGLALTSKTVRDRAAEAAEPVSDKAGQLLDQATRTIGAATGGAQQQVSETSEGAVKAAGDAKDALMGAAGGVAAQVTDVAGHIGDRITGGVEALKDTASAAPEQARQIIGDNAALIGGLGIAIGAIIAAALPETKIEAQTVGRVSDSVTSAAGEAVQSSMEAAKDATLPATDAAAKSVGKADLGAHASRITQNLAGTLKEAAGDVVDAALARSDDSSTREEKP